MQDDLYRSREQTGAKHALLRGYLTRFAQIILRQFGSLDYIDAFAGPWENQDKEKFSDTSFGIAVEILEGVRAEIAAEGKPASVRYIFNEKDRANFEQLETYARDARERYPEAEFHALRGTFAANAARMNALASSSFRLIYIDPTGWTGYPRNALQMVIRPQRCEVMINFMSSFIDRFFRSPAERRALWLDEMLGEERAATLASEEADEERLRQEIGQMLRKDLRIRHICQSPIAMADVNKIHFWMLYGTPHSRGVEIIRHEEARALKAYEEGRDLRREGGSDALFDLPALGPYSTLRKRHTEELRGLILTILGKFRTLKFGVLAVGIMELRCLTKPEVKAQVAALTKEGVVDDAWKKRRARARVPEDNDLIKLA